VREDDALAHGVGDRLADSNENPKSKLIQLTRKERQTHEKLGTTQYLDRNLQHDGHGIDRWRAHRCIR
jgi:hypothetical protein